MHSRLTLLPELGGGDMTKLCNHRRKLAIAFTHHLNNNAKKGEFLEYLNRMYWRGCRCVERKRGEGVEEVGELR